MQKVKLTRKEQKTQLKKMLGNDYKLFIYIYSILSLIFLAFILCFSLFYKINSKSELHGLLLLLSFFFCLFVVCLGGLNHSVNEYKDFSYKFENHSIRPLKNREIRVKVLSYLRYRELPLFFGFISIYIGLSITLLYEDNSQKLISLIIAALGLIVEICIIINLIVLYSSIKNKKLIIFSYNVLEVSPIIRKNRSGKQTIGYKLYVKLKDRKFILLYLLESRIDYVKNISFPKVLKGSYYKNSKIIREANILH